MLKNQFTRLKYIWIDHSLSFITWPITGNPVFYGANIQICGQLISTDWGGLLVIAINWKYKYKWEAHARWKFRLLHHSWEFALFYSKLNCDPQIQSYILVGWFLFSHRFPIILTFFVISMFYAHFHSPIPWPFTWYSYHHPSHRIHHLLTNPSAPLLPRTQ